VVRCDKCKEVLVYLIASNDERYYLTRRRPKRIKPRQFGTDAAVVRARCSCAVHRIVAAEIIELARARPTGRPPVLTLAPPSE